MYSVRKLKIGKTDQIDALAQATGLVYTLVVVFFWRVVRKKGIWLKPSSLMRLFTSKQLHAHTADAVVQSFFASLKSWQSRRKTDPKAKPPRRRPKFFKIVWKKSAIKIKDGQLRLSNGKGNSPLCIPWEWGLPAMVEVGWDGEQYELRAIYNEPVTVDPQGEIVAGVDLGEVHPAVAHTGEKCFIANGRELRSKRRYQNKLKKKLASKLDRKHKGSRRYRRLQSSKRKQLKKLNHQIREIEHKQTTRLISTLYNEGVQTVVIGDVREIRQNLDCGTTANQRLHQMPHGQTRWMLTYKAERHGMEVKLENEAYTSQTCPACSRRHKPKGREYRCQCGFRYHRDGVGSLNIRNKYLGHAVPVVGVTASPTGMRFKPHARVARIGEA